MVTQVREQKHVDVKKKVKRSALKITCVPEHLIQTHTRFNSRESHLQKQAGEIIEIKII